MWASENLCLSNSWECRVIHHVPILVSCAPSLPFPFPTVCPSPPPAYSTPQLLSFSLPRDSLFSCFGYGWTSRACPPLWWELGHKHGSHSQKVSRDLVLPSFPVAISNYMTVSLSCHLNCLWEVNSVGHRCWKFLWAVNVTLSGCDHSSKNRLCWFLTYPRKQTLCFNGFQISSPDKCCPIGTFLWLRLEFLLGR